MRFLRLRAGAGALAFIVAFSCGMTGVCADPSTPRTAAVASLRTVRGAQVGQPTTVGAYALVPWWNNHGGGAVLVQKTAAGWRKIGGGGGIFSAASLVRLYHVPPATAVQLIHRFDHG